MMPYLNLSALVVNRGEDSMTLYFDSMETMLQAKQALGHALPDLHVDIDQTPNRLLVRRPDAALDLIKLWFGAVSPQPRAARQTASQTEQPQPSKTRRRAGGESTDARLTKADQIIQMLQRPDGATADEVAQAFGIKKASAVARISVETRKRGLSVSLQDGRYHIG